MGARLGVTECCFITFSDRSWIDDLKDFKFEHPSKSNGIFSREINEETGNGLLGLGVGRFKHMPERSY